MTELSGIEAFPVLAEKKELMAHLLATNSTLFQ